MPACTRRSASTTSTSTPTSDAAEVCGRYDTETSVMGSPRRRRRRRRPRRRTERRGRLLVRIDRVALRPAARAAAAGEVFFTIFFLRLCAEVAGFGFGGRRSGGRRAPRRRGRGRRAPRRRGRGRRAPRELAGGRAVRAGGDRARRLRLGRTRGLRLGLARLHRPARRRRLGSPAAVAARPSLSIHAPAAASVRSTSSTATIRPHRGRGGGASSDGEGAGRPDRFAPGMLRWPLARGIDCAGGGAAYAPGELTVRGAACALCCALGPLGPRGPLAWTWLPGIGAIGPPTGVCGITGAGGATGSCACGCTSLAPVSIFCVGAIRFSPAGRRAPQPPQNRESGSFWVPQLGQRIPSRSVTHMAEGRPFLTTPDSPGAMWYFQTPLHGSGCGVLRLIPPHGSTVRSPPAVHRLRAVRDEPRRPRHRAQDRVKLQWSRP